MKPVDLLKKLRNRYVAFQVRRMRFPSFREESPCRKQIRFEGRVQRIGFRHEVRLIAEKLGLTGCARNLPDGSVLVELQGSPEAIARLVLTMKGLKRIRITGCVEEELPPVDGERGFTVG